MNGIINFNKPKGMTSFEAISKIKKSLKPNKIGHAGTLDPLASGVLVVLLGEATKLSSYLMSEQKKYLATITIGVSTTTEDTDGEIVEKVPVSNILTIDDVLTSFIGKYKQTPPMYSAIKKEGKKLYEYARKGETIEREDREVEIFEIHRTSEVQYVDGLCEFEFSVIVSKGTYIRTLCVDIGKQLGYPAHMKTLVRTCSGSFNLDDAIDFSSIENQSLPIVSMLEALKSYTIIDVNEEIKIKVLNGVKLPLETFNTTDSLIVLAHNQQLLAIYKKTDKEYRAERVWN